MPTIGLNGGIIGNAFGAILPKRGHRSALKQSVHIQQIAFDAIKALGQDLTQETDRELRVKICTAITNATKAWDCALNRKRVLKGQGVPAPVKADKPKRQRVHLDTPAEG